MVPFVSPSPDFPRFDVGLGELQQVNISFDIYFRASQQGINAESSIVQYTVSTGNAGWLSSYTYLGQTYIVGTTLTTFEGTGETDDFELVEPGIVLDNTTMLTGVSQAWGAPSDLLPYRSDSGAGNDSFSLVVYFNQLDPTAHSRLEILSGSEYRVTYHYEPSAPIPGDLDGDGDVDGVDISTMFASFNGPGGGVPANPLADMDNDGDVDGVDISAAFTAFTGPLTPVNVPEPASLAMLALGGFIATRQRR